MKTIGAAIAAFALVSLTAGQGAVAQTPSPTVLSAIFQDHLVLQRDTPMNVFGFAKPGESVEVKLDGASVLATADKSGKWTAVLPAKGAGGPYELTAKTKSGASQTVKDVLVGDVFLCSGQSNMEWTLGAAMNGYNDTNNSADSKLRFVTIAKDTSPTPIDEFRNPISWKIAAPDTSGAFSAVCYHFARDLRRRYDIPIGLVNSSWGGSAIEPWIAASKLSAVPGFADRIKILEQSTKAPVAAFANWGKIWQAWWLTQDKSQPWTDDAASWAKVPTEMTPWETWGVPELANFNGLVFYRTQLTLTAAQAKAGVSLSLGNVDEGDQTWVNGVAIGSSGSGDRNYILPKGLLKPGQNTVTVGVLDTWARGGIYGPTEKRAIVLADGAKVLLDTNGWSYRIAPNGINAPPRAPWEALQGSTTIGNAMIAPLRTFRFRGALWYQGESNTGRAEVYDTLLATLISDWRGRFGEKMPVFVVQLAGFGARSSTPYDTGWAELRERQRLAVKADGNAGLAVTIDIGDVWDIHPGQKTEVGLRLARAARAVIYKEAIPPSGPEPVNAVRQGDDVVITFDNVTDRLVTLSSHLVTGFELCAANGKDCRYASGIADGKVVRLVVPKGQTPGQVRFCWADSPICNLSDGSSLPAGPFRLAIPST